MFVNVSYSNKGQHLLTGMDNGVIRVHPLAVTESAINEYYISESLQDSQWSISVHDNDIGRVMESCVINNYSIALLIVR